MFNQNDYYSYDNVETVIYEEQGYKILVVNDCGNHHMWFEVVTAGGYISETDTFQEAIDRFNELVF